tara:strand:+ start:473 stop:637 length:165 start_codon:yes stop_codon:yes gene_type:complete
MEKSYNVTVEGLVSRVVCVLAATEAEAEAEAKQEFTSAVGALIAVVVSTERREK